MNGWALLVLIGVASAASLALLGVPRILWSLAGSALMLGAAGYARQQNATLPGRLAVANAIKLPVDPAYKEMRDALFGRFGGETVYFGIADRQLADGNTETAGAVMAGAVDYAPHNPAFWSEYGNVIALHDRGAVSPAALFAYRRAMAVAPNHAGPLFFLGWAYVRIGDMAAARAYWARALALTPRNASYREGIAERLAILDAFLAQNGPAR